MNKYSQIQINEIIASKGKKSFEFPFEVELKSPLNLENSDPIASVTFIREPLAEDVVSLPVENQTFGDFYPVTARMTGLSVAFIYKLKFTDARNLLTITSHFLKDQEDEIM